ncbi:MAG TPA: recombinase family protein, partial [Aldersonia sp.]
KEAPALSIAELESMLDSLGDIAITLDRGEASDKKALYEAIGIQMRYVPTENSILVTAEPRVVNARVRGGT